MLTEALAALAGAGGTAVVQAAGTDAWTAFRNRLATFFGRSGERSARTTLERLDRTAAELTAGASNGSPDGPPDASRDDELRDRLRDRWQNRIADLLEDLDDDEREAAAEELRAAVSLVDRRIGDARGVQVAGDHGLAAGSVTARAEQGSIAGGVVNIDGDVTLGNPSRPDSPQN
ncbi:hypothetical protein AB0I22_34675 [Streptomyces sp. NPDC050610]|uniref:hypothetical protein n=1 Tax=Streptomyces sp. NPDC050610 TaxID=3157097 RepID=UPI0034483CF3